MSPGRRLVAVLLLAASAGGAGTAHAQGDENGDGDGGEEAPGEDTEELVAVVRVASDDDAALLARIEGQTSDLDVELRIDRSGALDGGAGSISDQLVTARALAKRYEARVVVWFRRDGEACIVYVAEPEADRLLIRRVATDGGQMAGSAAAEAAALVVRTALRALAAGGTIGVDAPEPPPPETTTIVEPSRPARAPSSVRPLRPYGEVLWRGIVDGASDLGHHGVAARIGAAGGPWRVALAGGFQPAVAHERMEATIEVERIDVGAVLGLDLVGGARDERARRGWRIGADVGLGVVRYERRTVATTDPLTATPSAATWAAMLTPGVRIARHLFAATWLELALGIDLIGNAPEFGVAAGDSFDVHTRLWPAEPHAGLGIVVDAF